MDANKINEIINKYGAILEASANMSPSLLRPERILPYAKKTIKEALTEMIISPEWGTIGKDMQEAIKFGYCSLADFINDSEYDDIRDVPLYDKDNNKALKRFEKSTAERALLLNELEKIIKIRNAIKRT